MCTPLLAYPPDRASADPVRFASTLRGRGSRSPIYAQAAEDVVAATRPEFTCHLFASQAASAVHSQSSI
ncbi:hypothetical protein GCM10029964_083060 [Kibdelosporangium lantanae]